MLKITTILVDAGLNIIDLTKPGWLPTPELTKRDSQTLEAVEVKEVYHVILDLTSNSAIIGTDKNGLPTHSIKLHIDRGYHVEVTLQAALGPVFKKILRDCTDIFFRRRSR